MSLRLPAWLRGVLLILSLALISLLLKESGLEHLFERPWIDANVRGNGAHGYFLFLAAGALITAVGLPRQVVAFFAGYAFGVTLGLVLAALAALFGCVLAFYYARLFGRQLVSRMFPLKLQRFNEFVDGHAFSMTLLVRLLPVGSNLVTNLVAGVSSIGRLGFFIGSLLGYLPQTLVFVLLGSGLTVGSEWQIAISMALLIISSLTGIRLYRRMRRGRSYEPDMESIS